MIVTFLFSCFLVFHGKPRTKGPKGSSPGSLTIFHGLFQGFHPADDILAEHVSFKAMAFKPFARTAAFSRFVPLSPIGVDMLVAKE